MGRKPSSLVYKGWCVFSKDLKSELRNRYAINALLMFAVTTLVAVNFAVGQFGLGEKLLAALFWIVVFFSALSGLAQTFIKEEETKTASTLKLVASPNSIYLGKLTFNIALLFTLEVVIVPLFFLLSNVGGANLLLFFGVLILASLGLAAATTLIAAIVSKAAVKGALFAALSFPILLPLLVTAIRGTELSFRGEVFMSGFSELKILLSYLVVMIVASLMLFDFVWSE
jgi:heme exporter protein B